jgi:predicted metal-binding membrane protein
MGEASIASVLRRDSLIVVAALVVVMTIAAGGIVWLADDMSMPQVGAASGGMAGMNMSPHASSGAVAGMDMGRTAGNTHQRCSAPRLPAMGAA